jgi:hypothetical protein
VAKSRRYRRTVTRTTVPLGNRQHRQPAGSNTTSTVVNRQGTTATANWAALVQHCSTVPEMVQQQSGSTVQSARVPPGVGTVNRLRLPTAAPIMAVEYVTPVPAPPVLLPVTSYPAVQPGATEAVSPVIAITATGVPRCQHKRCHRCPVLYSMCCLNGRYLARLTLAANIAAQAVLTGKVNHKVSCHSNFALTG